MVCDVLIDYVLTKIMTIHYTDLQKREREPSGDIHQKQNVESGRPKVKLVEELGQSAKVN